MKELLDFFAEIDKIKHRERKGWENIELKGVKDTIASHSYGATLLGWILAKESNIDENKIIKLLLIHDLIMAYVKDYTPYDKSYLGKRNLENRAFKSLKANIPLSIKDEFTLLFAEYQKEETPEAIFARECDKLDTLLQATMYSKRLGKDNLSHFIENYEHKFKSNKGKAIISDLKKIKF